MKVPRINENFRLRQRRDGIWEVAWTDVETGMVHRRSTGTRDKRVATSQQVQIVADARAPKMRQAPTIRLIVDRYIESVARAKPDGNHAPMRASLRPIKERLGDLRWDQLTQDEVDSYVDWRLSNERWANDGRNRKKPAGTISKSTVQKDLRMLRAALRDALSRRDITSEVKFKINVSAAAPKDVWLTKTEVRRMLDACATWRPEKSIRPKPKGLAYLPHWQSLHVASSCSKEQESSPVKDRLAATRRRVV